MISLFCKSSEDTALLISTQSSTDLFYINPNVEKISRSNMRLEKLEQSSYFALRATYLALRLSVAFILLTIVPLFLPILLLVSLSIRKLVCVLAHIVNGAELREMVTGTSSLLAGDDLHGHPKANLLHVATLVGNIDVNKLRMVFTKNVIEATDDAGKLMYPELKQCITTWGGYFFWKECPHFSLEEHILLYDEGSGSTDGEIEHLRQNLSRQKWEINKPLWEIVLVQNCFPQFATERESHTTMFVRWHHVAGDGYAWLHLLFDRLCQRPKFRNALPTSLRRTLVSTILHWASIPFRGCWTISEYILFSFHHFDWRVTADQEDTTFLHVVSKPIAVESIKAIKNHLQVSFATVLTSALAGVHRRMLISKDIPLPESIPCWMTLPLPGHSLKLVNHM
jgi:hypothetical protein